MTRLQNLCALAVLMISNFVLAQPKKGQSIYGSIGIGYAFPVDETDINGSGFYAQAEYAYVPFSWLGVRPYAGVVFASGEEKKKAEFPSRIKANAAMVGVKARIAAPIPYVAPFVEGGIGLSVGNFATLTPEINERKSGVLIHIPFSIGVAVGRKHNFEVKFTYYEYPRLDQYSGAAAFGVSFPID